MTLRRLPLAELKQGPRALGGGQGHYLARVLRLRAGDVFVAFDPARDLEADGSVTSVNGDDVAVEIGPPRAGHALVGPEITWIQGVGKGGKCDDVVRDATELGVARIIVAATERSVVKLAAADARVSRWLRIAEQAARQCGRTKAPLVEIAASWDDALARVKAEAARACLAPQALEPLGSWLFASLGAGVPLAFACGPEGGLDAREIASSAAAGWHLASMGPLTLRTETVAAVVLGAVRVLESAVDASGT